MNPLPAPVAELGALALAQSIERKHLELLATLGTVRELEPAEVLLREGGRASHLSIVLHGRLALSLSDARENQHTVSTISRGEFVGWTALFEDMVEDGTTRAVKASQCVCFEAKRLVEACQRSPAFGFELTRFAFRSALHRLYDCHLQLVDLYGHARGQSPAT